MAKVRESMSSRGMLGLGNLGRAFKRTDWNGNKRLDRTELDDALRSVGVFLKSQELSSVFRAFETDASGAVRDGPMLWCALLPALGAVPVLRAAGTVKRFWVRGDALQPVPCLAGELRRVPARNEGAHE